LGHFFSSKYIGCGINGKSQGGKKKKKRFENPFKLMFNKYNKQCKVGEGHLNSYFYEKSEFYKVCNDYKSNVCFNIVVGFGN